jgi:replication factor C subunit 3/5
VDITTVASNYHIEMNPSDVGNSDRLVVQEVLKEIAQYHLADSNSKRGFKGTLATQSTWMQTPHTDEWLLTKTTPLCIFAQWCC